MEQNNDAKYYFEKGEKLLQEYRLEESIGNFTKAIEIDDKYKEAYYGIGCAYGLLGDLRLEKIKILGEISEYIKAIEYFTKAIEIDINYKEAYNDRGINYDKIKDHKKAIEDYTEAINIDEYYTDAYNNRGIAYSLKGNYERAVENFKKAIDLCDNDTQKKMYYFNLGMTFSYNKDYIESIKILKRIIALGVKEGDDYYDKVYLQLGILYYNKKMYKEAVKNFQKLIKKTIYTINIDSFYYMAHCYDKLNDYNNANQNLKNFLYDLKKCGIYNRYFRLIKISFSDILKNNNYKEFNKEIYKIINEIFNNKELDKNKNEIFNNKELDKNKNEISNNRELARIEDIEKNFSIKPNSHINEFILNIFLGYEISLSDKILLWRFALEIDELINLCKVDNNIKVCHYTKAENIKFLLKNENNIKTKKDIPIFRLYNCAYMNDPEEGKILNRILNKDSKLNELFNKQTKNYTYLSSFCPIEKNDELPMWVHYGNKGDGVSLTFDKNFFDEDNLYEVQYIDDKFDINEVTEDLLSIEKSIEKCEKDIKKIDFKVSLENKPIELEEQLKNIIKPIIIKDLKKLIKEYKLKNQLKKIYNMLNEKEFLENKDEKFNQYLNVLLNYASYLFKDKSYEYENELRIIKFEMDNIKITDENTPRLYVDFKEVKCKEILIGPKADYDKLSTYAQWVGIEKIEKSKIKYR